MVDLKALEAITGTPWKRDAIEPGSGVEEAYSEPGGLWVSRDVGSELWDAMLPGTGQDAAWGVEDPAVAVANVKDAWLRRKTARPNLRRVCFPCCATCRKAGFGFEGEIVCRDNGADEGVDALDLCDHYSPIPTKEPT